MNTSPKITRPWTRWCALSIITLGLLIASHPTSASTSPSRSGYVVDTESILSNYRLKKINRRLTKYHSKHGDEVVVGILGSPFEDVPAQDKLNQLMESWRIGADNERGMLILLITEAEEIHIQSGPKLISWIPDKALDVFRSTVLETQFEPKPLGRKLDQSLGKLLKEIDAFQEVEPFEAPETKDASQTKDAPQTRPSPQSVPSEQYSAVPIPSFDDAPKGSTRADEDRVDETVAEETPAASRSLRERLEDWLDKFSMFLFLGAFLVKPVLVALFVLQMIVKDLFDLDEEHSVMRFFEALMRAALDYWYAFAAFIIGVIATNIFGDSIGGWIVGLAFYIFMPRMSLDDSSSSDDGDSWSSDYGSSDDFGGGGGSFGGGGASGSW